MSHYKVHFLFISQCFQLSCSRSVFLAEAVHEAAKYIGLVANSVIVNYYLILLRSIFTLLPITRTYITKLFI